MATNTKKKSYRVAYVDMNGQFHYIEVSGDDPMLVIALLGSNDQIKLKQIWPPK